MFKLTLFLTKGKKRYLWLISVILAIVLTLPIVAGMEFLLERKITSNYLITGMIAAILVASVVSALVIYFLQQLVQLRKYNRHLNTIIDSCPVPIAINQAQNIVSLNLQFIKTFGYTLKDIPTLNDWWIKAYPDETYRQSIIESWAHHSQHVSFSNQSLKPLEVKIRCKNGLTKTAIVNASQLDEELNGLQLVVLHDISEKNALFEILSNSRNLLQSIIETIPLRVFWKDKDSRYLGCNTIFANDAGESHPDDMIGKFDQDLSWKVYAEQYRLDDQSVIKSNTAKLAYEEPQITPDGNQIILRSSKVPLRDNLGEVLGVLGIYEDITHQKKSENDLWLMKSIIDNSESSYFILNPEGRVSFVNDFACKVLGYSKKELIGMYPWQFDPDFQAADWPHVWIALKNSKTITIETRHRHKDGTIFNVLVTGHYINYNTEEFSFCFAQDITERKKIDSELRIAATAFESQEGMIVTDANAIILKINHSFTRITGYSPEEAVGKKMKLLKSGIHNAAFYQDMWNSITNLGSWQGEIWNKRKDGEIYPEWLTITAVKDTNGIVSHYVGTMIDITARKAIEERVHHLAHYDVLTDLPNRSLLTDRLHQALAQARREKSKLALMFLDLDNFKPVNDSLGHDTGDLLLKAVALRLEHCIKRESDTVSRVGGDEFVIILSHIDANKDAATIADEIVNAITQPFEINQQAINISCSIGIGIYPMHGTDVKTLMQVADNAMYEAKRAGRACFRFYDPETAIPTKSSLDNLIQ